MSISLSFASLVKSNNGMFKSEAQAKFLLSQCQETNTFSSGGNVYGNSFTLSYVCDDKGIVSVEKYLPGKGKVQTTWMRHVEGTTNAVESASKAKEIKRLNKEIKSLEKRIQARKEAFQAGEYVGMEELYNDSMGQDESSLVGYKAKLQSL